MLKTAFENLRSRSPLIHNITNYVTVNDCANIILAAGGSPSMADDIREAAESAAGADALAAVPEDIWAYIQENNR